MPSKQFLGVAVGVLFIAAPALAGTIVVPDDQPTIQAAVDAAVGGDVIQIKPGTYAENVVIATSQITLRGKGNATVDASGSAAPGLLLDGVNGVTIERLRVVDALGNGIEIDGGSDCIVQRCVIEGGANHAISARGGGTNHLITKNKISGNVGDGVDFGDTEDGVANDCTATKNKITGGDDGIDGAGSGHLITKNKIENVSCIGIKTGVNGTGSIVEKNKMKNIGETALLVRGTNMTFSKNKATDCTEDGAFVTGTGHSFTKDKIKNVGDDGINIDGGSGVTITSVKVIGAMDDAFDIEGPDNTLTKCSAKATGEHAFSLGSSRNTLDRCKARKSTLFDLSSAKPESENTFIKNKFDSDKIDFRDDC